MTRSRTSTYNTPAEQGNRAGQLDNRAAALAERTADAYSRGRYADWAGVARELLEAGWTERQAEAIMLSKHTRWAADFAEGQGAEYGKVPASAVTEFHARTFKTAAKLKREVTELVAWTFDREGNAR